MQRFRFVWFSFSCLFSFPVLAASVVTGDNGSGRVHMLGAVIDTPCAIALDSREQTVDMGTIPVAAIRHDGRGHPIPFIVNLVNCTLTHYGKDTPWKSFQITFDGNPESRGFGIDGDASGVVLQVSDAQGHVVTPGVPLPFADITPGQMQLSYSLVLMANGERLKPGYFFSSLRFRLAYY